MFGLLSSLSDPEDTLGALFCTDRCNVNDEARAGGMMICPCELCRHRTGSWRIYNERRIKPFELTPFSERPKSTSNPVQRCNYLLPT